MSHALDERLQSLWSCLDMGIIALPLGTTSAFCSGVLPIPVSFYGIRIIHCNARGKHSPFCCLFVRYTAGKVFPTIRWRHLLDDLSFRRDFNLLAYVKTEQVSCACFSLHKHSFTFKHTPTQRLLRL